MSNIGNTLRDARNKKSITLEEVHSKIKIHPRILGYLEENKFDKLPSPLFVKSFLKAYAQFLEINPEDLIQVYEKEERKDPTQVLFIRPAELRERKPLIDKSMIPLILGFLGIVAIVAGGFFIFKAVKKNWSMRPARQIQRTAVIATQSAGQEIKKSEYLKSAGQRNFPKINAEAPLSLKIKALDTVWLKITCDGKVLYESTMRRGTTDVWTAQNGIEIWTGNPANMDLSVNGARLGPLGKSATRKLTLTREGLKNK